MKRHALILQLFTMMVLGETSSLSAATLALTSAATSGTAGPGADFTLGYRFTARGPS